MAKIVVNIGHTKLGKGTGANNILNESIETRKIGYHLMKCLANTNHEIIPAVFDKSSNNLKDAVNVANKNKADLFISIHLNAGGGQGVECYTWKGEKLPLAEKICKNISALGFKNRGVKDGSHLYVIKKTKCPSILVECCFTDNMNDVKKYKPNEIANSIYYAICEVMKEVM